nr:ribonuclease H-like domain-containing protein [Tanacetum cinerariifolium]
PTKHDVTKAHSPTRRPFNLRPSPKHSNFHQKVTTVKTNQVNAVEGVKGNWGNLQHALKNKRVIDNGCSRKMTGNISYLSDFKAIHRGYVALGGNPKGGKITRKGKIRTGKLDFDDVYFVKELKFNLFSVSQMPTKHDVTKAHSPTRRPFNLRPSPKHSNFHQKVTTVKTNQVNAVEGVKGNWGNPHHALKNKRVIDNGCSRKMTVNISYLSDFKAIHRGYVALGGNPKGGKITGKGKIRTGKLDFDDVYFVKELKFNLFSVSQMCDKKNS